ncbi:hypothetical protein DACRYDRAFT_108647 [Dacryopinax primogenitus]|uniref:Amino acid permease/ SLC12A domain-containing protein n=1 Tax=Dacryopinax primogenitus (strain DJM 731) TaxID=1858805 RepID=M5G410_DACPD|nr:uncharacterized protein DACRYDRAFT_108647 [Dacryopinax primogenitus]EJU00577.1 hypothetical protein DACRYDRAFT_108647 [Dacryopinax primogenitus]
MPTTIRHRLSRPAYRLVPLPRRSPTNGVNRPHENQDPGTSEAEAWHARWKNVMDTLPAQITRQQIEKISIGGAIGTGLFLGLNTALQHGGPLGLVLGYALMGTVVYCTVISFGEMVSFQPHIGGPVGLAHLYVDEALAFALGWNAWYNWTIVLPAEISAAVLLVGYWSGGNYAWGVTAAFMVTVLLANCLGTAWYGRFEVGFTRLKVATILLLIVMGLIIDVGGSPRGPLWFRYWQDPGLFNGQMFAPGALGNFLGFFSVLLQAAFSFFGSEVPAIAAGEVVNAGKNIPIALKWIWIRITLFYVIGVFIVSLLVPYDNPDLNNTSGTASQSPFVIALNLASWRGLPHVFNALFLASAWSAASSDVYISSRFMFNLARLGHAPRFMGWLFQPLGRGKIAIPWVGIAVAGLFSGLALMQDGGGQTAETFHWLSSMTSAAALQAWIGILFTYIRWYQGTRRAIQDGQRRREDFHRHWLQPYAAYYAFGMCCLVLVSNSWAVFVATDWRLALGPGETWPPAFDSTAEYQAVSGPVVPIFITSYLPIPAFLILLFGYKLVYQTKMVKVENMPSHLSYHISEEEVAEEPEPDYASMPMWKRYGLYALNIVS